jgi:hypothetical protein
MKKGFFLCFFTCLLISASAQNVEKYLEVSVTPKFSRGVNVSIYVGEDSSLFAFKDKTIKEKILSASKCKTTVDVLNYLASLGWTLVNSFPNTNGGNTVGYFYYLKKNV